VTGDRRRLGARGEDLAARWYAASGYQLLDRNWRCAEGEIDLICRMGAMVVVCEVKTRRSNAFGSPAEAVTAAKRARLRRLAARWLREHDVHCATVRFDVAAVVGEQVQVVASAW
jgi:putative endonuclease